MIEWIAGNIANIVIVAVLAAAVVLIIVKMVRDRRSGKSSCGCDCASCPGACGCSIRNKKAE